MSYLEHCRFDYDISPQDVVLDLGGYKGDFAEEIHKRYGCEVLVFEPIFHESCQDRLRQYSPKIKVISAGVGGCTRDALMGMKDNSSGEFSGGTSIRVQMIGIGEVAQREFALAKINTEGSEYEILESVIKLGIASKFRNLQVQFHDNAPNFMARYEAIRTALLKTHHLNHDTPFVWQNFELNKFELPNMAPMR